MFRHVSIGEFVFNLPAGLCGSSTPVPLLFDKKSCDDHEIVRKHSGSHQEFKSLTTFSQATFHATPAEENGDSAFNTGTETLAILEGWTFFVGLLGLRFFPAALRDAHKLDTSFRAMFDIPFAEKSSIGTVNLGHITERFPVAFQRGFDVGVILGIPIEHLVLRDQAAGAFRDVDFMAEFHWLQDLASFDQVSVRFKYGKDLLLIQHLLFIKHPSSCLINDTVPKAAIMVDLFSNRFDCDFGHQINATDSFSLFKYFARISDNLLRGVNEFTIFGYQPPRAFLLRGHSHNFLHAPSGTATSVRKSRYALRKQFVEISDQPGDNAYGIPQQGAVGWVMDVKC
jgi:hypothetical protein